VSIQASLLRPTRRGATTGGGPARALTRPSCWPRCTLRRSPRSGWARRVARWWLRNRDRYRSDRTRGCTRPA